MSSKEHASSNCLAYHTCVSGHHPTKRRTKFNVRITNETGSIFAIIFTEKAEALFDVTATELAQHAAAVNLPISLIEKLSAQKTQFINLKATMYEYGGINRCVFTVNSVSNPINTKELLQLQPSQPQLSQPQPPKTPSKRPQQESSKVTSSASFSDMEEDESIQPLKHKQKKEL